MATESSPPPESGGARKILRDVALAMELPFVLVAGLLLGGGIGHWLDRQINSAPLFTFLLGALGFAAGVREVIRRIPKDEGPGGRS